MEMAKGMRLRCRPGDLAIVTKCGVLARLGLLVRVVGRSPTAPHDWLTEVQGPGVVGRDVLTGEIRMCKEALMYDWNLTPINGTGLPRQAFRGEWKPHPGEIAEASPSTR